MPAERLTAAIGSNVLDSVERAENAEALADLLRLVGHISTLGQRLVIIGASAAC